MTVLADFDSKSLQALLGAPMDTERALRLSCALACALIDLHENGCFHGNVCPSTVLVDDVDNVHLIGIGIGIDLRTGGGQDRSCNPTPGFDSTAYSAPERLDHQKYSIDSRCDLYSLGVIIHEMLSGEPPVVGPSASERHVDSLSKSLHPPGDLVARPRALDVIVLKLLSERADDRYQTAAALESDLRHCLDELRRGARGEVSPVGQASRPLGAATAGRGHRTIGPSSEVVARIAHALSDEMVPDQLVEKLLRLAMEHGGADRGLMILGDRSRLETAAEATAMSGYTTVLLRRASLDPHDVAESVLTCALRTHRRAMLEGAPVDGPPLGESGSLHHDARSVLCIPILKGETCAGVFYLERNQAPYGFSKNRIDLLEVIASLGSALLANAGRSAERDRENQGRQRIDEELRRSEEFLALAQRMTLTSSCWWRVSTGEIIWSAESYRLLDYAPEVKPSLDLIMQRCHPDDLDHLQEVLGRSALHGTDFELTHRLLMPDDSVKHVHVKAHNTRIDSPNYEYVAAIVDVTEHHAMQAQLEHAVAQALAAEERLQKIIDALPAMAWSTRVDGQLDFLSQRWYDYTGHSRIEVQGRGWLGAVYPDDLGRLDEQFATGSEFQAAELEVEARLRRFDGEYRWFIFRARLLTDERSKLTHWYGTSTDIEDRKRAESQLRRSNIYMEYAQKLSHTGSVGYRRVDGEVLWSDETARIYGYEPPVRSSQDMVMQRVHPDDREFMRGIFAQAAEGGTSFDFKHRLLMTDGSVKHVHTLAQSISDDLGQEEVLGAITDITQQYNDKLRIEDALREVQQSESRLQTIIETIPALIWSAQPDGAADYYSQAWLRYTGLSMSQATGTGWSRAIHPDDVSDVFERWAQIKESRAQGSVEARFRRFDGEFRWFKFRAAPLVDKGGNVIRWYGTNSDIDDQKRSERLLAGEKSLFEMIATGKPLHVILLAVCRLFGELTDGLYVCLRVPEIGNAALWSCCDDAPLKTSCSELQSVSLVSSNRVEFGSLEVYAKDQARSITLTEQSVAERCAQLASIVIERKRAADSLEKSEAFLAEGQKISHTGSFKWSIATGEITWSEEMFRIFEFDRSIPVTYDSILDRIHPDDRPAVREELRRSEGRGLDVEYRLLLPDGAVKHIYIVTQQADDEGMSGEVIGALMDVTASRQSQASLRRSLDEKDALLKEVHHRVKNNLQLITSLLNLQASQISDPAVAELFSESRNRVRSMALVHENLYRAGDLSRVQMRGHIQNLCAHLRRVYGLGMGRIKLDTEVEDVELDLDRAVSAGLIVNELVSNALKHAFPFGMGGQVLVALKVVGPNRCRLSVRDDGIGLHPAKGSEHGESLGLRLVRSLVLQLHGEVVVDVGQGTFFSVDFELGNPGVSKS